MKSVEELQKAFVAIRRHKRYLHYLSVAGQQELKARLSPARPPTWLVPAFAGALLLTIGVTLLQRSLGMLTIGVVVIGFIALLARARQRSENEREELTLEPVAVLSQGLSSSGDLLLDCEGMPGDELPGGLPIHEQSGRAVITLPGAHNKLERGRKNPPRGAVKENERKGPPLWVVPVIAIALVPVVAVIAVAMLEISRNRLALGIGVLAFLASAIFLIRQLKRSFGRNEDKGGAAPSQAEEKPPMKVTPAILVAHEGVTLLLEALEPTTLEASAPE